MLTCLVCYFMDFGVFLYTIGLCINQICLDCIPVIDLHVHLPFEFAVSCMSVNTACSLPPVPVFGSEPLVQCVHPINCIQLVYLSQLSYLYSMCFPKRERAAILVDSFLSWLKMYLYLIVFCYLIPLEGGLVCTLEHLMGVCLHLSAFYCYFVNNSSAQHLSQVLLFVKMCFIYKFDCDAL